MNEDYEKSDAEGWGCSSVVRHMLSMCQVMVQFSAPKTIQPKTKL